jgi:SufS family cysteine desulfurase
MMHPTRRDLLKLLSYTTIMGGGYASHSSSEVQTASIGNLLAHFPQLARTHNGHPLSYLDSAATTLRPRPVLEAMQRFYETQNANPSRESHSMAATAADAFDSARAQIAKFINARDPLEIIWTRGTTESLNLVATAWGGAHLQAGDEVLLTLSEHASSMLPWQIACEKARATIRYLDVDESGRLNLSDLDKLLSKKTKLVCFTHVSNVLGAINPAKEICRRAKAAGARVMVDAAQSIPHFAVDVQELNCDFAAFSSHKMLGPMGIGVLYATREAMEEIPAYQSGSNMAHARSLTEWDYAPGALRFGAGTPNVADAIGIASASELLTRLDRKQLWSREQNITVYALSRLRSVPNLKVIGPTTAEQRVSIFSFVMDRVSVSAIVGRLDELGICIRVGDLASMPLLQKFGLNSAARASLYIYSTESDVNRLVDGLQMLLARKCQ